MVLSKVLSRKNSFFVDVLKVKDENSRIRIWSRIHCSEPLVHCHGSTTLLPITIAKNEPLQVKSSKSSQ
jgi:hypothetical protein